MLNRIIAIVGMCGSGKSVASDYLEKQGFQKVYFGGVTLEKVKEAGLPITPENEKMMREKLRSQFGMGAYAKILLPRIKELAEIGDTVLDGLYSWDELKILKEELKDQLMVVAVITDKKIRYQRLKEREVRPLNEEEAIARDLAEIENIAKAGPIAYADYYINNNDSIESYLAQLETILRKI